MCFRHLTECVMGLACHKPRSVGCSPLLQEPPQPVCDHCASLPAMSSVHSSSSDMLGPMQYISHRLELQQYEERLEVHLEIKLDDFHEKVQVLWSGGWC